MSHNEPLLDTLNRVIQDLEHQQDRQGQLAFVKRRIGNVVMHLKQLRDDVKTELPGRTA